MISEHRNLSYERRLQHLELISLEQRRLRGQLIETFECLNCRNNVTLEGRFERDVERRGRQSSAQFSPESVGFSAPLWETSFKCPLNFWESRTRFLLVIFDVQKKNKIERRRSFIQPRFSWADSLERQRSGSLSSSKACGAQFYWKCLYCFGVAGLVSAAALIRQTVPAFHGSALPTPHFGAVSCWFAKSSAMAVYLFGPITILLVMNLVCFCLASFRICTLIKRSDRTNTHFVQYLKLFLLMGVSWIFEVISFFVDGSGNSFLSYTWIFFDFVNIMQGVLIFVVFVCRPSVLRHLATALCGSSCSGRCFVPPEEKDRDETEIAPCNTVV
ncbi:GPCR family 2 secretin-like [Trinorchestia longiramus]|nr:GPCR family 2 secretin-like [Trinorchestia longiramus]